jgi:hypothetical protein
LREFSEQNK